MMKRFLILATMALATAVQADTLHLDAGITVDGIVKVRPDGIFEVEAGGRKVLYRPEEVLQHEKNDRTGHLNMDEVKAQVAEELARLERETGLNAEQRARVDELVIRLESGSATSQLDARERLVAMNQEVSIVRYIKSMFDQLITPALLEAIAHVAPSDCIEQLERGVKHSNYLCRAKAIDLFAQKGYAPAAPLVARGLADHKLEVNLSAAYALAKMNERAATPALIELLSQPDLKLSNASQQALETLWKSEIPADAPAPKTVSEWNALISGKSISGAFTLSSLQPLIAPDEEFIIG